MHPLLEVKGLKVGFRFQNETRLAVKGISYQVFPGETLAIVGESGCGKSLSALSILRLLPYPPIEVFEGTIKFKSLDILKMHRDALNQIRGKAISMVFQDPMTSLNPTYTIGNQIEESILRHTTLLKTEARKKAIDLLEQVEIPSAQEKLYAYPHQLSGGMRQRALIAIALSCEPELLIADEPTTALDVLIQAQILELLQKLKDDRSMSILFITHDLGVVSEIAQRVLVMYAGEIVEMGPVQNLFKEPLHPYTKGLINSVPTLKNSTRRKSRLSEIPGQVPALGDSPGGCSFHPRCPEAIDKCKTDAPPLKEYSPGHQARCWLYE